MCFVVEDHNSELAGLLIENNINIDEEDQDGYTPLMKAVDVGDIELIGLLIDNGADINHVNASRNSAVSMAKDSLSEKIKEYFAALYARPRDREL